MVSVDDFWGTLTVGFVAYFIGGKFIDSLAASVTATGNQGSNAPLAASLAAPVNVANPAPPAGGAPPDGAPPPPDAGPDR
jgi:hypothetical protein